MPWQRFGRIALALAGACGACSWTTCVYAAEEVAPPKFDAAAIEFFEKEVRPLLASRCYECHSGQSKKLQGELRLDARKFWLKGGDTGAAAVPGDPKKSLAIDAINYGDLFQMPPKTRLSAAEVATLTKWVEMGLPWPASDEPTAVAKKPDFNLAERKAAHWCWQPIGSPALPAVKNAAWATAPIDRFVLAKMEEHGLSPAAPANPVTLLRRLYFDLIGLPPILKEEGAAIKEELLGIDVSAFLRSTASSAERQSAIEQVVDALLKSPHFGERWGRHWLDLARYAESRGHEFDYTIANVWHYRDYVIRAFNADLPYDQFVTEHLAGDLLEKPRLNADGGNESLLGTGFWFLGDWVHSPVDIRKDETDRHDNMLDVASKTFLGVTVACARCHDHKFDAISQADYYALAGYLHSTGYRQAAFDTLPHNARVAAELAPVREQLRTAAAQATGELLAAGLVDLPEFLAAAHDLAVSPKKPREKKITQVAGQQGVSPVLAKAWSDELRAALADPAHVLHVWAKVAREVPEGDAEKFAAVVKQMREQAATTTEKPAAVEWIVDYTHPAPGDFLADGFLFGAAPEAAGTLRLGSQLDQLLTGVNTRGVVRNDSAFAGLKGKAGNENDHGAVGGLPRSGRTFRTRTFTISKGPLFLLVRGRGWSYAAVASHHLVHGPLHGSIVKHFDAKDKLAWVVHDLKPYVGQRTHLEFTPEGDENFEVFAVAQGETPPGLPAAPASVAAFTPEQTQSLESLAAAYTALFQQVAAELKAGWKPKSPSPALLAAADWMLQRRELFVGDRKPSAQQAAVIEKLLAEQARLTDLVKRESRTAPAMWEGDAVQERLLTRGNSRTPAAEVPRRPPEALGGLALEAPKTGSGRLELARHIVDPEHPLTSRVMANRVWHHLFDRGLVPTVDNFGVLGERPSHPELLDHLARQFMREGWSVKRLIRSVVLTNAYQQASAPSELAAAKDPGNTWLSHAHVRRLEGEAIRDAMLAVSGRLDAQQFGPSVPVHLTEFLQGRGRPGSGPVDGAGRRSIYLSVRRNFLSPMLLAFDLPQPTSTFGRRNTSNVPAQALTLMNDPFVAAEATRFAERTLKMPLAEVDAKIGYMYRTALARSPSNDELAAAREFLGQQAAQYGVTGEAAQTDVRAWSDLAHVLFNLKEFIYLQ